MRKIINWNKFGNRGFRILEDEEIQKGDHFICNDRIYLCKNRNGFWLNGGSVNAKMCTKIEFDDNIKMKFNEGKPEVVMTAPEGLKKGDLVYFLDGYDLMYGKVLSIGKKNIKIDAVGYGSRYEKYVPFDKVALPNEKIVVVWETWKGSNGRGGYRIERKLYPEYQKMAKDWDHQAKLSENEYGVSSSYYPGISKSKIKDFSDFLNNIK